MMVFEEIFRILENRSGMVLDADKKEKLTSAIARRIRDFGLRSPAEYLNMIGSWEGRGELIELISEITVGETYFFRNRNHWRAFSQFALPAVIRANSAGERRLKFWSLGCSTGEEPYTIAMCLYESLPFPINWDITILATDINGKFIEKAKKGVFGKNSFRGIAPEYLERYFIKDRKGFRIREHIRKMVEFQRLNIVNAEGAFPPHRDFDFIFCRNLLMYLKPDIHCKVVLDIAGVLKANGFLFLGHAEGPMAPDSIFEPVNIHDAFIYRKKTKSEMDVPATISNTRIVRTKGAKQSEKKKAKLRRKTPSTRLPVPPTGEKTGHVGGPYDKAFALYLREDFQSALDTLRNADNGKSGDIRTFVLRGLICVNISDLDLASKYHRLAFEISDVSPEVFMLESMIREARQDFEGARTAGRAAIFLDGNFFVPYFRLGHIYQSRGDIRKARRCFGNALRALKKDNRERIKLFCGDVSEKMLEEICRRRSGNED